MKIELFRAELERRISELEVMSRRAAETPSAWDARAADVARLEEVRALLAKLDEQAAAEAPRAAPVHHEERGKAAMGESEEKWVVGQRHCDSVVDVATRLAGDACGSGGPEIYDKEMAAWLRWRIHEGWDTTRLSYMDTYDAAVRAMALAALAIWEIRDAERKEACNRIGDEST